MAHIEDNESGWFLAPDEPTLSYFKADGKTGVGVYKNDSWISYWYSYYR